VTVTGDAERDLAQLVAMVGALDRFLDDPVPYRDVAVTWPRGGTQPVTMSLGVIVDLSAALDRHRDVLVAGDDAAFDAAVATWHRVRSARQAAYGEKLRHELRSQIDTWRWYVDDLARGEGSAGESYPSAVDRRRRIAQLLAEAATVGADVRQARDSIAALDETLRRRFRRGAFVGPREEAALFPPDAYWWLYGRPAEEDEP
jgi:hypothetical protein